MTNETFVAGVGFIAGTSTTLTLANAYGSVSNIWVNFDGVYQGLDQIASLVGNTLTFTSAITAYTTRVYIKGGTNISTGTPGSASVTVPTLGPDVGTLIAATQNGYVGSSTTDPTTRIDGSNLKSGDRYYNTTLGLEKTYNGTAWFIPSIGTTQLSTGTGSLVGFTQTGTGAVLRSLQAKGNDAVSTKDFGSSGGVSDDTTAFQAAVNAASASKSPLWVYECLISSNITIPSNLTVIFQGTVTSTVGSVILCSGDSINLLFFKGNGAGLYFNYASTNIEVYKPFVTGGTSGIIFASGFG